MPDLAVPAADGTEWKVVVYSLERDLIPLRMAARNGDRVAMAAVVRLTAVAHAMDVGGQEGCVAYQFHFAGRRRPGGVATAVRCDDPGMAPLAAAICHFCVDARRQADLLDALLDQVEARVAG